MHKIIFLNTKNNSLHYEQVYGQRCLRYKQVYGQRCLVKTPECGYIANTRPHLLYWRGLYRSVGITHPASITVTRIAGLY